MINHLFLQISLPREKHENKSLVKINLLTVLHRCVIVMGFSEAGKLSPEDKGILKDLSSKMQKRKNKFRDLEDVLPHKHG